ncbi:MULTISPECIES: hypothetical protein [Bifidobacterium]|uniref:hypothetical protein n=1 Tax=Bifidobacterium TaxID=1678 RepID=UPI002648A239|nr:MULTISPECIES: hypothetical protein [Bifidobacterium]MDN5978664.1 hypothetical protein [Bifidobacterium mongoliense]MDN6016744.1 hypothetical protein [Bifidobacterium mongoliense]MDN6467713.1 hypothetical protein [Bifidobacterium crudilactis]MDN6558720.1 hypothetical protein [Bifidobacterium crudilactis]MDN6622152.1 hypothetical protein [Bifidobacterium crudilactis]
MDIVTGLLGFVGVLIMVGGLAVTAKGFEGFRSAYIERDVMGLAGRILLVVGGLALMVIGFRFRSLFF